MNKSSDNHPIFHEDHLDKNVRKLSQDIEYLTHQEMKENLQLALYSLTVMEKYGKLPVQAGHFYVHPDLAELRFVDVM